MQQKFKEKYADLAKKTTLL